MNTSSRTVVILGAGPSALLVAHAAVRAGLVPHIWSKWDNGRISLPRKSRIYGCQYLHAEIPDLHVAETEVDYKVWGFPETYRDKVYGSEMDGEVSPSYLEGKHQAWDLRAAYDRLWDTYVQRMGGGTILVRGEFGVDGSMKEFTEIYPNAPIISTIPAQNLCSNSAHEFGGQSIWAMGDAPEAGQGIPAELPDNTVICNGLSVHDGPLWYRGSRVFGYGTLEWPGDSLHPKEAAKVIKPLSTTCDCWGDRITKMGRYGEWKKGVLTSDVFDQATKFFLEM